MPRYRARKVNKKILLLILLVVLLVGGFFVYRHFSSKPKSGSPVKTSLPAEQKVDLSPATQQDTEDVNQHKEDLSKNDQSNSSQGADLKSVSLVIVDAAQYDQQVEVRAYVAGVVENGGTCTYTFTSGSSKVTKQTKAVADATTTRCPTLDVAKSEFSVGNWSVSVSYKSLTAQGTSSAKSFEVK
jgi:hypothetical protein